MLRNHAYHGLFVGLVTLDFIYLAAAPPENNQKVVAFDHAVAAGGPATNAAVTFSALGHQATLLTVLGTHPITQFIRTDLTAGDVSAQSRFQVAIADLDPTHPEPPSTSSIMVTAATGERAVISLNAVNQQAHLNQIPDAILQDVDIVLIDGHQMVVGQAIAQQAKSQGIPIVVDGGSWKPGFESVLSLVDYAICSANFQPPECQTSEDTITYLKALGIAHIAITHGAQPIQYVHDGGSGQISIPQIKSVDTLGAGDIFHGAFCHYLLHHNFIEALAAAAQVASHACQSFGTRRWLDDIQGQLKN
ncbi:MAG: sugar kinase [Cyanothece sp. SIO1E1]|nr:sugar kinase [Cyanothece sp. SIO1E1]